MCTLQWLFVYFHSYMQHILIRMPKMLQPPLPQRHPHVLCSLACLISQPGLTHHLIDMREKNIACLSSSPQWSHMLQCNAAYESCHLLSSISALLVFINLSLPHTVIRGLSVRRDYSWSSCRWLKQLFSCPEWRRQRKTKALSHSFCSSSSQSVRSDDVSVACSSKLLLFS